MAEYEYEYEGRGGGERGGGDVGEGGIVSEFANGDERGGEGEERTREYRDSEWSGPVEVEVASYE